MAKKNVLITGGAGFVGSNLAVHLEENEPEYNIVCFDNLKRHGSEHNLERLKEHGIRFVHGDIRNKEDFSEAGKFDIMIECSAEQSVPSGHDGSPQYMINTNLTGAINCFEAARSNNAVTIFLSSGRIYPMDVINGLSYYEKSTRYELKSPQKIAGVSSNGFSEQFPINGVRSMYGATKIAAEFLLKEYIHAYGMKGVINRCGVTTGPWQTGKADQGFAVLWVASHMKNKNLAYEGFGGNGKQVRDIMHVSDLYELVIKQIKRIDAVNGKIFNVGGGAENSLSFQELTGICQRVTGETVNIKKIKDNGPDDMIYYVTDNEKVCNELGWAPLHKKEQIIVDIYEWLKRNRKILDMIV